MQKKIIALAVAGLVSGAAFAQSNVTIYGIADVGVEVGNYGAGTTTRVQSGQSAGSRIGFKGEEALGNGLKAMFLMESGVSLDTGNQSHAGAGASATTSSLFGRQAYAGISSATLGQATLGRQYTAIYNVLVKADAFGYGLGASLGNSLAKINGNTSRTDNTLIYATPTFAGFSGAVAYGSGAAAGAESQNQVVGSDVDKAGRYMSGMAQYNNGPAYVGLAYSETTQANNIDQAKNWALGGSYDFKVVKAFASYSNGKTEAGNASVNPSVKADGWSVGAKAPFGAHSVMAQYAKLNDKMSTDADYTVWGLGYEYAMSKRTALYAAYAHGYNKNNAAYALDGAAAGASAVTGVVAGSSPWNVMTGVRHSF